MENSVIHGPDNWFHLNWRRYLDLGGTIAFVLDSGETFDVWYLVSGIQ